MARQRRVNTQYTRRPSRRRGYGHRMRNFRANSSLVPVLRRRAFRHVFSPFAVGAGDSSVLANIEILPGKADSLFADTSTP